MDEHDRALLRQVHDLVERERELRDRLARDADDDRVTDRASLRHLEEELDQCWDLLRQRRAKREFGEQADEAATRPPSVVEHYLQ